jgi:hypothetical protein
LVQAEEDGKGVIVSARGGTPHSVWMVDYLKWDGRIWMLLQNTAYGRYLAREEGMEPTAALIVDYQHPEQEELLWEIDMKLGIGGQGFLVNRKYATWDVSSQPCIFEAILATPTPPRLPTPPVSLLRQLFNLLYEHFVLITMQSSDLFIQLPLLYSRLIFSPHFIIATARGACAAVDCALSGERC